MNISEEILLTKSIKPLENDLDSNLMYFIFNKTELKQQLFFELFSDINNISFPTNEIINDIVRV